MSAGNVARVIVVLAACAAAAGSATSSSSSNQPLGGAQNGPPPPQQMDPGRALGLWSSNFGAVKIEADTRRGGLESGNLQGVWVYQRQGQEVIGYFSGNLRGNVLQFRWQEPSNPPLTGEGYLVFETEGRQFGGRWWSDRRDRVGDWNGWRQTAGQRTPPLGTEAGGQWGGQPEGAQPAPYGRPSPSPSQQPYQRQPYQQQPYQRQPYQQPPYQQPPYQQQPSQQPYQQQPYQQQPSQQPYYN